jgi:formyl-CoA transferase
VAGDRDLASNPDFATVPLRAQNRQALIAHLNDVLRSKPSQFWVEELNKAGVPCGPINTIDQVFADPQVKHLGIRRPVDHPKLGTYDIVGQPIHMSAFPQPERLRPTPDQGQHTDEVLRELGYEAAAIKELHGKGVV